MKYLVVAADDLGLTGSVNEGIARACTEGIVTSVNLLPTGEAFDDALTVAKELGLKEAGAHLALTETRPLTDRSQIPTLVTKDGAFLKGHKDFFLKYLLNGIDLDQAYIELKAQMDRLDATGLTITNLSSHEHIHMLPGIFDIFLKLAKEYDIPAIRYPHGEALGGGFSLRKIYKKAALSFFRPGMVRRLKGSSIKTPDHFIGFLDSGNMNEQVLLERLRALRDGSTELVTHPGFLGPEVLDRYRFHIHGEAELFALTSARVKKCIRQSGITLVRYGEIISR